MPDITLTPLPTLDLLSNPPVDTLRWNPTVLAEMAQTIESCLALYNITVTVVGISQGPVFTLFELQLAPGVMVSRVVALQHDLARTLSAERLRILLTIPGKPYVGIELLNKYRQAVYVREILGSTAFQENLSPLAVALGKDITGHPVVVDLARMPHLLIGGMTGSGKSVLLDAIILSLLYKTTPREVRFIMIDPKMLDLTLYEGIPHLLTGVVTGMKDTGDVLRWCIKEVERRYRLMSALGVRNLADYNARVDQARSMSRPIPDPFWKPSGNEGDIPPVLVREPFVVVIVDNFGELMMAGEWVKELIVCLTQKAHVAGIHLILSTSLPSMVAIANSIRASIPGRIALTVRSKGDSDIILGKRGAELLLGAGDMLFTDSGFHEPRRIHSAFVSEREIYAVVQDWKVREQPLYLKGIFSSDGDIVEPDGEEELDPLFDQAVNFVVSKHSASVSGIQRQFRMGYNRAVRIIEQMEAHGIVGAQDYNGHRAVLTARPLD